MDKKSLLKMKQVSSGRTIHVKITNIQVTSNLAKITKCYGFNGKEYCKK